MIRGNVDASRLVAIIDNLIYDKKTACGRSFFAGGEKLQSGNKSYSLITDSPNPLTSHFSSARMQPVKDVTAFIYTNSIFWRKKQ